MVLLPSLLTGFVLAVLIALAAWRVHALNGQGALAALLLGTVIFGLGGLGWAIVLMGFFVSSSALSRLFRRRKAKLEEKFSKGSQRDAGQVLANGGIAGLFVLLHAVFPGAAWPWAAFAGALAAANADTWATELGVLNPHPPRLITTGAVVEGGTSGGISQLGLLAAFAGSLLIALLGVVFWNGRVLALSADAPGWLANLLGGSLPPLTFSRAFALLLAIAFAGLLGSLVDSYLGATIQAIYYCPACQKETERYPLHTCGTLTTLRRGLPWLDNDWVNTFCTLCGALFALAASLIIR